MNRNFFIISVLILVAALSRLLPAHIANFASVGAIALFAGAFIGNRILSFLVPLAALVISDMFLGYYGWEMLPVYGAFCLTIVLGYGLRNNQSLFRVAGFSLLSSLLFFVITNFALFYPETLYPHTLSGIVSSYIAGIPFFRYTLAGDFFYNAVLFGGWYLLRINVPALSAERS